MNDVITDCADGHECHEHDDGHEHGPGCGHEPVEHEGHTDYVVGDHLHHPHGDHCDHHGPAEQAA